MQFTEKHYEILKDIVYEECGIDLHEGKLELLKARVAKRMRLLKLNTVSEYVKLVKKDEDEFINFIDAVTTNHTFFFRENHHCEFLLNAIDNSNYLKIWSAASSSGEEPYSIAIQLLDKRYRFEIFASDISNTMLRLARRGIYLKDKAKLIPPSVLRKYFQLGYDVWKDHIKVKNEVKTHVTYGKHNLITDSSPGVFDIVFCRNVMIYFDDLVRQKVLDKLYNSIEYGGYLIIGASEGLVRQNHNFKYIEPSIYMK